MHRRTASVLILTAFAVGLVGCTADANTDHTPSPSRTAGQPQAGGPTPAATGIDGADDTDGAWQHAFDELAEKHGNSPYGASWGTFGEAGSVAPLGNNYGSVPAGKHVVTLACAGPVSVEASIASSGQTTAPLTRTVTCGVETTVSYTSDAEGIDITLDSKGVQGAWFTDIG